MDRTQVAGDLARLRRGRGVLRPDLDRSVGLALRDVLDIDPGASALELRGRLTVALTHATSLLSPDLGRLAAAAYGLTASEPTMTRRLAVADSRDRDVRTWRRRLVEADLVVADHLISGARRRSEPEGWYWGSYRMQVDVSGPRPVFTTVRTVVAVVDDLDEVQELMTLPSGRELSQVGIEALSGCRLAGAERVSASGWRLRLALPAPLAVGDEQPVTVRFTWPERSWIHPLAASIPVRTIAELDVEVRFGRPRSCQRAWVLDGVLPTAFLDPPGPGQVVETETVSARFEEVRRGLLYGVCWEWA